MVLCVGGWMHACIHACMHVCGKGIGVRLSTDELLTTLRVFDKNRDGTVDYLEFYSVITQPARQDEVSGHCV